MVVGAYADEQAHEHEGNDSEQSGKSRFGARADVLAVRVASVAKVSGDDGLELALLERSIHKLVRARPPACQWTLADHPESGSPAIQTLHIGSIRADVGYRLQVHKRFLCVGGCQALHYKKKA